MEREKICLEIDKTSITKTSDPCYVEAKQRIGALYTKYIAELKEIPDNPCTTNGSNQSDLTDGQLFHKKQKGRLDSLMRSIEDVERKLAAGDDLESPYCKMKFKLIHDASLTRMLPGYDLNTQDWQHIRKLIQLFSLVSLTTHSGEQIYRDFFVAIHL